MFRPLHTLLLNASYEPLRVVSWRKAFCLVFQSKVEILEEYNEVAHSVSEEFRIPAVIKLSKWIFLKNLPTMVRFSRMNVYLRDGYVCQYCGVEQPEKFLTLDHVNPVVKGGKKSWDNIVTACKSCNQKKANLMLHEAGMKLLQEPKKPRWLPGKLTLNADGSLPKLWEKYIPKGMLPEKTDRSQPKKKKVA